MNWNELITSKYCEKALLHSKQSDLRPYDRVLMLQRELPFYSTQAIYFASWEDYLSLAPDGEYTFILWIGEVDPEYALYAFSTRANQSNRIILFREKGAYDECLSGLFRYVDRMQKMLSCAQELYSIAANNVGITRMVDAVAEVCGCHASVIDNAYSIMAYSRHYTPSSTLANSNSMGYLDMQFQATLKREFSAVGSARQKRRAVYFVSEISEGVTIHNYFVRIFINDLVVGFLSVTSEGKPLPDGAEDHLWLFSDAFSTEMQKSNFYLLNKQTFYTHLFSELLEADPIQTGDMEARLLSFGYKLLPVKYVLCVDIRNESLNSGGLQALAEQLHNLFSNSIYLARESSILYLMSRSEDNDLTEAELDIWAENIGSSSIKVGISRPFSDIVETSFHLSEASRALSCGSVLEPKKNIYLFSDFVLHDMIYQLSQKASINIYCHPALQKLYDYDVAHKTNLCLTLYHYLADPKRPLEVCKKLFIHKNTLYYRLDKIFSITGCDFDNAKTVSEFLISFYIFLLQGKTKDLQGKQDT